MSTLDNQIDPVTGTVKLRALFDNKDLKLFPSQFVNARLLIDTLHDAVVVPAAAILRGAPGTYVYLINPDKTVTVRVVTVGPSQGERQAIIAGLEPGAAVVVDGSDKLHEGAKVTLPEDAGPSKGSSDGKGGKHDKSGDSAQKRRKKSGDA